MEVKKLKVKVKKFKLVPWKTLTPFQTGEEKDFAPEDREKLKSSFLDNDIIHVFTVWKEGVKIWLMDGHHRLEVLRDLEEEGIVLPDEFPCLFVDFKSRKEAANSPLVYSSQYARYTDKGLADFIKNENLDLDFLKETVTFPDIDMDFLQNRFFENILPVNVVFQDEGEIVPKEKKKRERTCPECGYTW